MSNCPSCGATGCYEGLTSVECVDPRCKHFSRKQCKEFLQEYFRERLLSCIGDYNFNEPIDLPFGFFVNHAVHDVIIITVSLDPTKDLVHTIQF